MKPSKEAAAAAEEIFDIVTLRTWEGQDERRRFAEIIDTHFGPVWHALEHAAEVRREGRAPARCPAEHRGDHCTRPKKGKP